MLILSAEKQQQQINKTVRAVLLCSFIALKAILAIFRLYASKFFHDRKEATKVIAKNYCKAKVPRHTLILTICSLYLVEYTKLKKKLIL